MGMQKHDLPGERDPLTDHAGQLTGVYADDEIDALRDEWMSGGDSGGVAGPWPSNASQPPSKSVNRAVRLLRQDDIGRQLAEPLEDAEAEWLNAPVE